jgi:hypothetical protein
VEKIFGEKNMNKIDVMDTTKICCNFPLAVEQQIIRESFIETIENMFEKNQIIFVDGQNGIGKTTLLTQFIQRHIDHAMMIFITPVTQSSYDQEIIRVNLLNQAYWMLNKKEISDDELESFDIKSQWGLKKAQLQRKAKVERCKYFFIVDGLEDIPNINSQYRDLILDLLPFGFGDEFKFLVSGSSDNYSKQLLSKINYKTFQMSPFTLDEAYQNLRDLEFSKDEVTDLYKLFKYPGQLAVIRRLIKSGSTKKEFLDDLPKNTEHLLSLEWEKVDLSMPKAIEIIGVIAFASFTVNIFDITQILSIQSEDILEIIKDITFLRLTESNEVKFINEEHQKIALSKFDQLKEKIEGKIIDYLKGSSDPRALIFLPTVYNKSGRLTELISYLTPDNISKIIKNCQSLIPIKEIIKLGVEAAQKSKRDGDLIGFGFLSSTIQELFSSEIWESEINTLIALRDVQSALTLIERTSTKEDRLYLLSVLANAQEKYGLDIQDIDLRIKNAYSQVDYEKLGDKALDIAANLINIDSMRDLSFEIIEKNTNNQKSENALDWAFVKLSVKAMSGSTKKEESIDIVERIQKRIQDPKARLFITSGSLIFLDFDAERIVNEAKKLEKASEQLYLIRSWVKKNRENEKIEAVVEYGLSIAINTVDYVPNARDFRDLSIALPYIKDLQKRKQLIKIIDGQKGNIELIGPTEDYIRILLALGVASKEISLEQFKNYFIDTYLYISLEVKDLSTKSSCFARLSAALAIYDSDKELENKDRLHTSVNQELDTSNDELLKSTADQYLTTKGIIRALAKADSMKAYLITQKLNGQDGRDRGVYDLIISYLDLKDNELNYSLLFDWLVSINAKTIQDEALINIFSRINNIKDKKDIQIDKIKKFIELINKVMDSMDRCEVLCSCINVLFRINEIELLNKLKEELTNTWELIDIGWIKVDLGYKIVESLIEIPDFPKEMYKKVNNYRDTLILDSDTTALSFIGCAKLNIRAFGGLLENNLENELDFQKVLKNIENIPSMTERVGLYSDLALKCKFAQKNERFAEIVKNQIRPSLEKIPESDGLAKNLAIIRSAPALYLCHPTSTKAMINRMQDFNFRDAAYISICSYFLTESFGDSFYDPINSNIKKITYEETADVINLVNEIENDAQAYEILSKLVDGMIKNRNNIDRNKKADISRELLEISEKKFPNKKFILHHGYRLISKSSIYRLSTTKISDWNELITQAKSINIADRAYILMQIVSDLPNSEIEKKKELLSEIEELISKIPSVYDQINRYEFLAHTAFSIDRTLSQRIIKTGMDLISTQDNILLDMPQKNFVDLAYRINPDFAASLSSTIDNDPARVKNRIASKKRYEQLKLKDEIIEAGEGINEKFDEKKDYASTAWTILGALNSGRVAPKRFEEIKDYLKIGSILPISESYPIYAWLIQNNLLKYKFTPQVKDYIYPFFEATLASCNLILSIAQKATIQTKIAKKNSESKENKSIVIVDMDTDEAQILLKKWLRKNIQDVFYISDPYFDVNDLWILQEVNCINPDCKVFILTSRTKRKKALSGEELLSYWYENLADQPPPPTDIVIAEMGSSRISPIHDRWMVTKKAGVRIGTSMNSLGRNRISELCEMTLNESEERLDQIQRFVVNKERIYKSEKIQYITFTL